VASFTEHVADIAKGAGSIVQGMVVTLRNALRPRVTRNYPAQPTKLQPRFRGRLVHCRAEDGGPKCTACMLCRQACPTEAIREIEGEGKGKDRRATRYVWDASRCLFCNLCVEACPFGAIRLGQEHRMVGESRQEVCFELEDLLEPSEEGEP
jgi:NADH-quinone oxidoreductase subunit I